MAFDLMLLVRRHGMRPCPLAHVHSRTQVVRLSSQELREIFRKMDSNGDGQISQIEFIKGLRHNPELAAQLDLPSSIHQVCRFATCIVLRVVFALALCLCVCVCVVCAPPDESRKIVDHPQIS